MEDKACLKWLYLTETSLLEVNFCTLKIVYIDGIIYENTFTCCKCLCFRGCD